MNSAMNKVNLNRRLSKYWLPGEEGIGGCHPGSEKANKTDKEDKVDMSDKFLLIGYSGKVNGKDILHTNVNKEFLTLGELDAFMWVMQREEELRYPGGEVELYAAYRNPYGKRG